MAQKKQDKRGVCPKCGHNNLRFPGDQIRDYPIQIIKWNCPKCRVEGFEQYLLKFTGHKIKGRDYEKFPDYKNLGKLDKKGGTEMAKKFQLVEAVSGGEVAEEIEADTYEEAAAEVLEGMGYQLLEVKDEDEEG